MALGQKPLFSETELARALKFERYRALSVAVAALAGAPTLAALTPMALDPATGHWVPWNNANTPAGTNVIRGFLDPVSSGEFEGGDGLVTSATDETVAVVIVEGKFHHDSIALPSGETQNNLDTALKALRVNSPLLRVQGLQGAI